jgi:hypothetical protein
MKATNALVAGYLALGPTTYYFCRQSFSERRDAILIAMENQEIFSHDDIIEDAKREALKKQLRDLYEGGSSNSKSN